MKKITFAFLFFILSASAVKAQNIIPAQYQELVKKSQKDLEALKAQIGYLIQNGISAEPSSLSDDSGLWIREMQLQWPDRKDWCCSGCGFCRLSLYYRLSKTRHDI